ncbi:MAG TPA: hypothetical protein VHO25_20165 [Polyangiaceae bacterium]|nr:hypothetical protein [Polyangiaceae bacterium]
MTLPKQIDRKTFLTWTVSSAGAAAFGCSADVAEDPVAMGGNTAIGGGGAGGMAGTAGGGAGGAQGGGGAGGAQGGGGAGGAQGGGGAGGAQGGGGAGGAQGGGGAGGAANNDECGAAGTAEFLSVFITADHMHALQVPVADVTAGVAKSYDTTGESGHPHWIYLTAADFTTLAGGGTVIKYSCNDNHEHEFIITGMEGGMACDTPDIMTRAECFVEGQDLECGDVDGNYCDADEDDVLGETDECPLEAGATANGCPP